MAKKTVKRKQEIPIDETKQQRFTRVVVPRVNKAVKAIGVIGFCCGSTYEHTPEQTQQILKVLDAAFQSLSKKLSGQADSGGSFSLD